MNSTYLWQKSQCKLSAKSTMNCKPYLLTFNIFHKSHLLCFAMTAIGNTTWRSKDQPWILTCWPSGPSLALKTSRRIPWFLTRASMSPPRFSPRADVLCSSRFWCLIWGSAGLTKNKNIGPLRTHVLRSGWCWLLICWSAGLYKNDDKIQPLWSHVLCSSRVWLLLFGQLA